jgi:hypothetical protein
VENPEFAGLGAEDFRAIKRALVAEGMDAGTTYDPWNQVAGAGGTAGLLVVLENVDEHRAGFLALDGADAPTRREFAAGATGTTLEDNASRHG